MATKSVLGLGVALELDGRAQKKLAKQIRKELGNIEIGLDTGSIASDLDRVASDVEGLISEAAEKGFKGVDGDSLRHIVKKYTWEQSESAKKIASIEAQLADKNISAKKKQYLRNEQERHAKQLKLAEERFKADLKANKEAFEEFDRSLQRANDRMGSSATEFGAKLSQGFGEAADTLINSLKGGDLQGLLKGIGNTAGSAGEALTARGETRQGQGRAGGQTLQEVGKIVKSLGKAAMFAGAIAGAFAAIVKLMIDADSQAREFNSTLMEGAGAADLYAANFYDLAGTLDVARDAAVDFRRNMQMGTTAQETLETIRAFNQAGLVFNEITGDAEDATEQIERLQNASDLALTYSRLTGMATQETAEHMTRMVEEFGLTLDGVAGKFSTVLDAAMMSGFGVNRFYSMVLQATSGMAIYNARVEETAGLLMMLGDILGSDMAGEFVQQLQRGFADEGMTDRFARIMRTGSDRMQDIFQRSAVDTAEGFLQNLEGRGLENMFGAAGLTLDGEGLVEFLSGLSAEDQSQLVAQMRLADADLARQLRTLINVSEGTQGGMDAMARNMGALDAGGRLSAMLNSAAALFEEPIHEMSATNLAAFEQIAGISGQELEQLIAVSEGIHGNYSELQRLREQGVELTAEHVDAYGAALDEHGNLVAAHLDENNDIIRDQTPIESIEDYIQSQGDSLAQSMEEGVAEDLLLNREIASNIVGLSNLIENGVQYWLEQIYSSMRGISDMISRLPGVNGGFFRQRRDALASVQSDIGTKRERIQDIQAAIADLERQRNMASGEDREEFNRQIEDQNRTLHRVQAALQVLEIRRDELRGAFDQPTLTRVLQGGSQRELEHIVEEYGASPQVDSQATALERDMQVIMNRLQDWTENGARDADGYLHSADSVMTRLRGRGAHSVALREALVEGTDISAERILTERAVAFDPFGMSRTAGVGLSTSSGRNLGSVFPSQVGGFQADLTEVMSISDNATAEAVAQMTNDIVNEQSDLVDTQWEREQRENRDRDRDANESRIEAAEHGAGLFSDVMRETDMWSLAGELADSSGRSAGDIFRELQEGEYNLPSDFRGSSEAARRAVSRINANMNDFIYRRDGTVTPINRSDEIVGYRPGGPIERAAGRGGGPVTIHVHGGDEARVYNTVQRALRGLGYGPGKVSSSA